MDVSGVNFSNLAPLMIIWQVRHHLLQNSRGILYADHVQYTLFALIFCGEMSQMFLKFLWLKKFYHLFFFNSFSKFSRVSPLLQGTMDNFLYSTLHSRLECNVECNKLSIVP